MTRPGARVSSLLLLIFSAFLLRAQVACQSDDYGKPIAAGDTSLFQPPFIIDVLKNDRAPKGGTLYVDPSGFSQAVGGTPVKLPDQRVQFNPAPGAVQGSFKYTVRDEASNASTATVTLLPAQSVYTTVSVSCTLELCTLRVFPSATDGLKAYDWDFGDGRVLRGWLGSSVSHYYPIVKNTNPNVEETARYTATVTMYYTTRDPVTATADVVVSDTVAIDWHSNRDDNSYGLDVVARVTNSSSLPQDASYSIRWEDGTAPEGKVYLDVGNDWKHVYATAGTKKITISYCRPGQSCTTSSREIYVENRKPTPHFQTIQKPDPKRPGQLLPKTFRFEPYFMTNGWITASTDDEYRADQDPYKPKPYEWDFGDGTHAVGTWRSDGYPDAVEHTYAKPGTYKVTLQVTDSEGAVGSDWDPLVKALNEPPTAAFTYKCDGHQCDFDASSSKDDSGLTLYQWVFGNVGTHNTTEPKVAGAAFPAAGPQVVTLKVSDGQTDSAVVSRVVNIADSGPAEPLQYYTITPCRVFVGNAQTGNRLAGGVEKTISVGGTCGVPADAAAVTANFTITNPTGNGNLQAYASNRSAPGASVVNFRPERSPRAGAGVVALNAGTLKVLASIFNTSTPAADLIVDVTGYFSSAAGVAAGAGGPYGFEPLTPCRVVDSRTAGNAGLLINPNPAYQKVRGRCGVPSSFGAAGGAAVLNLAVIGATANGNLNLYPSAAASQPGTSSVNFQTAYLNIANGLVSGMSERVPNDDDVAIAYNTATSGASTHYLLDTTGYFSVSGRHRYFPITQCVFADTRDPQRGEPRLTANQIQAFLLKGNCGVPPDAVAAVVTATVFAPDGSGNLALFPSDIDPPGTSVINFSNGESAITNTTVMPLSSLPLDLSVRSSAGTDVILSVTGYFAPPDEQ